MQWSFPERHREVCLWAGSPRDASVRLDRVLEKELRLSLCPAETGNGSRHPVGRYLEASALLVSGKTCFLSRRFQFRVMPLNDSDQVERRSKGHLALLSEVRRAYLLVGTKATYLRTS